MCSWARHFTKVYKWVPASNLMLGVTFLWTSIPPRGEQKLFSNFLIFFLIFNFLIFYYFYFIFLRGNRNFIKPMSSRSIYGGDRNTPKWHWFNEIKKYVCKLCENNLIFRSLVYSFIGYKVINILNICFMLQKPGKLQPDEPLGLYKDLTFYDYIFHLPTGCLWVAGIFSVL